MSGEAHLRPEGKRAFATVSFPGFASALSDGEVPEPITLLRSRQHDLTVMYGTRAVLKPPSHVIARTGRPTARPRYTADSASPAQPHRTRQP